MTESVAPGALTALLREMAQSPGPDDLPPLRSGDVVGRFEIVRRLGQGGFGIVYEAFDRTLRRAVAFKVVRTGGDVGLKEERILREAEAAAQLSHPNLVTLHDVGHCDRGPYLVMELLRGRTLGERLRDGALPVAEAVAIAVEVANGVAHAHARGVVHRDVTPANVFLCEDGRVKVLDFGLALAFGAGRVHGGTVAYMAPEQWRAEPEDGRTDVFALGVIVHEMLTGARPFESPEAVARARTRLDLPGGAALSGLVHRMTAADPADRPRDGGEVLEALRAISAELPARPASPPSRRVRAALAAGAALAVLVAAAGLLEVRRTSAIALAPPAAATAAVIAAEPAVRPGPPAPSSEPPPVAPPTPPRPRRPTPAHECRDGIGSLRVPAPASGEGILTVVADPFGTYSVDGVSRGDTPGECRVAAGTHAVRVVHPTLGARAAKVRVAAGARSTWAADLLSPE